MLYQLIIGTLVILMTVLVSGAAFLLAEVAISRASIWLIRKPHAPRLALVLMTTVLLVLAIMTVSVWLWALTFLRLGVFAGVEPAVYFSVVAFTTLGFGDILLPVEWRILGGLAAANGLLNMGLYAAFLVEVLRRVRVEQVQGVADED